MRWAPGCAVAMLSLALALPMEAPAGVSGTIEDFRVLKKSTKKDSKTRKRVRPGCEAASPDFPLGMGGSVSSRPNLALNLFGASSIPPTIGATEADPVSEKWKLSGEVYCASTGPMTPQAGQAASALKDVSVHASGFNSATDSKSVTAECPDGKRAIGGGAAVSPFSELGITQMKRLGGGYKVRAHELDPLDGAWTVSSRVICANITTETATSDYAVGPITASANTGIDTLNVKSATANCQAGSAVIGGWAHIQDPQGDLVPPAEVVLTESAPDGTGDDVDKWTAVARETDVTDVRVEPPRRRPLRGDGRRPACLVLFRVFEHRGQRVDHRRIELGPGKRAKLGGLGALSHELVAALRGPDDAREDGDLRSREPRRAGPVVVLGDAEDPLAHDLGDARAAGELGARLVVGARGSVDPPDVG